MRVISPSSAASLAALIALLGAALLAVVAPPAAGEQRWWRPVPGEVARSFSYSRATPFARGAHRGADLAAARGTKVRAACGGRVMHAGSVAGTASVSVLCDRESRRVDRRVSYLPLAGIRVGAGNRVGPGAVLGAVAPGHSGSLHIGVRREGDSFGYSDPLAWLDREPPALPPPAVGRG